MTSPSPADDRNGGESADLDVVGPMERTVNRETEAWNERDVEALLDLFHPDMVWAWPPTPRDHDPRTWELEYGRFDRDRGGRTGRRCSTPTSSSTIDG